MSSRKPSKPSTKPSGTSVARTSAGASSSTRLPTLKKISSSQHSEKGTVLRSDLDAKMATRQLKYESLSGRDRDEQEKWAQNRLKLNTCSAGFRWVRETGGYRCSPPKTLGEGNHFVTDELLAEGKGRQHCKLPPFSHAAKLLLPDGSLWTEPIPALENYSERVRGRQRQIRIDSRGRKWEAIGGFPRYIMLADPESWTQVRWKRV